VIAHIIVAAAFVAVSSELIVLSTGLWVLDLDTPTLLDLPPVVGAGVAAGRLPAC